MSSTLSPLKSSYSLTDPNRTYATVLKADSGATGHYLRTSDKAILQKLHPTTSGPTVRLPDHQLITPTQSGILPIPTLHDFACTAHIYPKLQSASLLSIGQLCDNDCTALFTKHDLKILNKHNNLILTGHRNLSDGLWDIDLTSNYTPCPTTTSLNIIMRFDKTKKELAQYYHACVGSPVQSSFIAAIANGNFITWPGLSVDLIKSTFLQ